MTIHYGINNIHHSHSHFHIHNFLRLTFNPEPRSLRFPYRPPTGTIQQVQLPRQHTFTKHGRVRSRLHFSQPNLT